MVTDTYSWDWGRLHLVQMHRFAGDTSKGAVDSLPWLKADLAAYAADGRPVILFQHYGWDAFSTERWDPARAHLRRHRRRARRTGGARRSATRWSRRSRPTTSSRIFHGHEHESALIYRADGVDLFKPKAAYLGGFAIVRVTDAFLDVVLAEVVGDAGDLAFTHAFSKPLPGR